MTSQPVTHLNTRYPTLVLNQQLVDPEIIESLSESTGQKRHTTVHEYYGTMNPIKQSVVYTCSDLLNEYGFTHNRYKWTMDVIRYNLDKETQRVDSGLAWHCENDNGYDLITVLLYLRLDDTIIDGNLRYKDKGNKKQIIQIQSGMTIIMDGKVPHKPQDPYGTGKRDVIIVSFQKQ